MYCKKNRFRQSDGRSSVRITSLERAPRAKRDAFCYACGLRTGDDDDSQAGGEAEKSHAKPAPPQPVTAKP